MEPLLARASVSVQQNLSGRGMDNVHKATEAGKGFATGVDPEYEARLVAVAQEMTEKIEVKDRSYHFKTHKNCFIGKVRADALLSPPDRTWFCSWACQRAFKLQEAVKFLVWSGRAANIAEALALGNALMQRGVFSHITNDHSFKNEDLFYCFNLESLPQKGYSTSTHAFDSKVENVKQ